MTVIRVGIGSTNASKVAGISRAFGQFFNQSELVFFPMQTKSGVSNQPIGYVETVRGAINRMYQVLDRIDLNVDFAVGPESGLIRDDPSFRTAGTADRINDTDLSYDNGWADGGIVVIGHRTSGLRYRARTPAMPVPASWVNRVRIEGLEIGDITDELLNDQQTKQKGGSSAFLTDGVLNREDDYFDGTVRALAQHVLSELFV